MATIHTVRTVLYDAHDNVLLGQRPFGSKSRPGQLDLFGGKVDVDERPIDAAYREVREELCVDLAGKALRDLYVTEEVDGDDTYVRHYYDAQIDRFRSEKLSEHIGSVLMPLIVAVSSVQFEAHREALSRLLGQ